MSVGFPGLSDLHRRAIRADINPMDKSTVVSIYPHLIDETKHTLQPGHFIIEPGTYERPSILVVGTSSWWREIDEDQPLLEIPVSSVLIANSIVTDFCNGLLECNMTDIMPGLFFIPGEVKPVELKTTHKVKLDKAAANQKRWYQSLVKRADIEWSRNNGNPLAISDDMRIAARETGAHTKEWLQDFQNVDMMKCVACGALRNPTYPICGTCHQIIDVEKYKSLGVKSVEK